MLRRSGIKRDTDSSCQAGAAIVRSFERTIWYLFAAILGAGGMFFQLAVHKSLSTQLGTSNGTLSLVVAVFMAGLGLGMWIFGIWKPLFPDKIKLFALIQFFTGVSIVLIMICLKQIDSTLYRHPVSTTPLIHACVVFLFLLIPTIGLGGGLALLYRIVTEEQEKRGRTIGSVMGWNTFGSVLGAISTTFWLLPHIGISKMVLFASLLFLSTGAASFVIPGREKRHASYRSGGETNRSDAVAIPNGMLVVIAGVAGFCGLGMEVLWVRLLASFIPNRQISFGIILSLYLSGYALGNLLSSRMIAHGSNALKKLVAICALLGVFALASVPLVRWLPDLLYSLRYRMTNPVAQIVLPPAILSTGLILPSAILMGMLLPLLVHLYRIERSSVGDDVGSIYGSNLFGSVAGSLISGIGLLSFFGTLRSLIILGMIYAAVGWLLLNRSSDRRPRSAVINIPVLIVALGIISLTLYNHFPKPLPVSVFRDVRRDDRLLFYKETPSGTISVVENQKTGVRSSFIDNSAVCGTTYDALKTVFMLAHLPLLMHGNPKTVLVIGFGLGVTSGHVLAYPVEEVDCAELCPGIIEAAPLYRDYNRDVIEDRRIRFIGIDGRMWLKRTDKLYDVITCDPTHPVLGSGNLFTVEYFRLARSRLRPGGVMVQYLPFQFLSGEELRSAIATFSEVFPESSLWLGHSHGILMGTLSPQNLDPKRWDMTLRESPARSELVKMSLSRPHDWLSVVLMGPEELGTYAKGSNIVTDDLPVLEYPSMLSLHPMSWPDNLAVLSSMRSTRTASNLLLGTLEGDTDDRKVLERFYTAKTLMIKGSVEERRGNLPEALKLYEEARATNWDDAEIRMFHRSLLTKLGIERKNTFFNK